ncbi:alpha/beta hydrolase [Kluyvera ascorbata]|uniref:alpha/beta hydrolase n=1 Tax=Kluyvera ascorbata TaxID=51288 RepID=UPI0004E2FFFC|nr:alpha/beta hydrolase [Kluyvera ascorbata]EJG2385782.1 alpha/beta hydrolase [Kluyvera ascorbata]KFD07018.1 xylanase [Kluyvera ascorbata ATCC 33433]MDU1195859.1 alpha/beta hydrolase [Kluyvera ascorbata]STW97671.1 Predicted esterase [Kluyvera ascorbata]BCA38447.1 xylanase [Kluyvera ascorbata]
MIRLPLSAALVLAFSAQAAFAALPILSVWPNGEAPGAKNSPVTYALVDRSKDPKLSDRAVTGIRAPQITVYAPAHPNGVALLVTPGGSYQRVVLDKEGSDLAAPFNAKGYTLFVMTYRMPADGHAEGANAPLADAQRALRTVRANAAKWHINPQKIGVMGFSAGGHVAASLETRYDEAVYSPLDDVDKQSARPDFVVLGYPVISMDKAIAHPGSSTALIGDTPSAEQIKHYSPELNVTAQTPPTFLMHAVDDPSVPVDNSLVMFNALRAHNVPTELHLFAEGKHGFGIRGTKGLPAAAWPELAMNWVASLP